MPDVPNTILPTKTGQQAGTGELDVEGCPLSRQIKCIFKEKERLKEHKIEPSLVCVNLF